MKLSDFASSYAGAPMYETTGRTGNYIILFLFTLVNKNRIVQSHTESRSEPFSFHPRVKNLTSVQFAKDEMTLLEKGLKYNITPNINQNALEMLAVDSEITAVVNKKDNMVKGLLANEIKGTPSGSSFNPERVALRSLKQTIDNNNLVISKADKGNTVVVMERDDYLDRVNDVIQGEQFLRVPSDPTNKFLAKLKLAINNNQYFFQTESSKKKLIPMNPRAPSLYGLPKIHKTDIPVRPVVSYIGAPAYELAKSLNFIIKEKLSFRPPYAIKNSLQLVNKIKDVTLPPRCKLVSLDVDSLFTNVPRKETLGILRNALEKRLPPGESNELLTLTKTCMEQNYFRFNGEFFVQDDGLAMGSPLSPLMAEIFMDDFEQRNIVVNKSILYYFRYVDDCFLCWTGTQRQLDVFVKELNKKHIKIKFKLECEDNNTLNFLDLSITRVNNKHSFGIFRKPTYTNTTIHASSCHPWQHKLAAFHSYIHRLLSIPLSKDNYQNELNIIFQIAISNGYSPKIINNILKNKNKKELVKFLYAGPIDKEVVRYKSSLTYMGEVSARLSKIMKNNDMHVAFRTNNTLKHHLCHNKDRIDEKYQSGVYKIDCPECDSVYVGQTGRSFETRYKEHIAAYRNGHPDKSHFAKHLLDSNHTVPDGHSYEVLHKCDKGFRLSVLEQLEIIKEKKNNRFALLNDQTCLTTSPLINMFGGTGEGSGGSSGAR